MSSKEEIASFKHLRSNLKQVLRASGVLGNVKAQIRKEFIAGLTKKQPNLSAKELSIQERILTSIVFNFLQSKHLDHTLSVFVADNAVDTQQLFTDKEIGRITGWADLPIVSDADNKFSLLEHIVSFHGQKYCAKTTTSETQTDMGTFESSFDELDHNLRHLRQSIFSRKESIGIDTVRSVEERMIAYQRDCEDRYRSELNARLSFFRETEIAKVRIEESRKAAAELDADYQHKLKLHADRETQSIRNTAERERVSQQTQFESRERLQREIDITRERERAASRKIELEAQGLHMLELRMKEVQALLECREREVSERERLVETKTRDLTEKVHNETRQLVQADVDALMREKMSLAIDRQRLDDERAAQSAWLEGAQANRRLLRDVQGKILDKDEEIKDLKLSLSRLEQRFSINKVC